MTNQKRIDELKNLIAIQTEILCSLSRARGKNVLELIKLTTGQKV